MCACSIGENTLLYLCPVILNFKFPLYGGHFTAELSQMFSGSIITMTVSTLLSSWKCARFTRVMKFKANPLAVPCACQLSQI